MNLRRCLCAGSAVLLLGTAGIGLSLADDDISQRELRNALARGEVLPLTRILQAAAEAVPGDVLEVEIERDDGRIVYEVSVLTAKGRVRELKIDARTAEILEIEDD